MKTAYSYIRFSTKGQATGDSLPRQLKKAREYAAKHNLLLDDLSYRDLGMSGFNGKNIRDGALGAFLKAVADGDVPSDAILLLDNLDRLSRAKPTVALSVFMDIVNLGITLITIPGDSSPPTVFTADKINTDGGMSLFGAMMVLTRAHDESVRKSGFSKSAHANALKDGKKKGKCPFWLKPTDDRMGHTIIEDKAAIVRQCFQMRLDGIGSQRIARHLNDTFGFKYGTPQTVRLLQNPAVIGTRLSQAGHKPLFDFYTPIIDKPLFNAVQRLMTANQSTKRGRRAEDEPNLFTGLARCALCGKSMRFFRASKTVSQQYIRCVSAVTGAGCKAPGYVNYDAFEKEVIGWLLLDQDDDFVSLLEKKPARKVVSQAEIDSLREQQSWLMDVSRGLTDKQMAQDKINALQAQIEALTSIVEEPVTEMLFAEKAWALVERHDDAKFAVADGEDPQQLYAVRRELKAAFTRSIEQINVYPEQRVDDVHHCKFSVQFRSYKGTPEHEYKRPALNNVKGVFNGR